MSDGKQDDEEPELTEQEIIEVNDLVATIKNQNFTENIDFNWIEELKVYCRNISKRKLIRENDVVFDQLKAAAMFNINKQVSNDTLSNLTNVFAVLANIVVKDNGEDFTTCFKIFDTALFSMMLIELNKTLSFNTTELGIDQAILTRFKFVTIIALQNLVNQFCQNWKGMDERGPEVYAAFNQTRDATDIYDLFYTLGLDDQDQSIRKEVITLLLRLSELDNFRRDVCSANRFKDILKLTNEKLVNHDDFENIQPFLSLICASIYLAPLKVAQSVVNILSSELCNGLVSNSFWSKESRFTYYAIKIFNNLMRGKLLMPGEKEKEEDIKLIQNKIDLLRNETNLFKTCLKRVKTLMNELLAGDPTDIRNKTKPSNLIKSLLDLSNTFLSPIEQHQDILDQHFENNFHVDLFKVIRYTSVFIELSKEDANKKKKEDDKADIDRDLILAYAKLRKACIFDLNILATSHERCEKLLNITLSEEDKFSYSVNNATVCFEGKLLTMTCYIVHTMYKFDSDGTELAMSLLKNIFLGDKTKQICLQQIEFLEKNGVALKDFGKSLGAMTTHPSHKVAMLTANVIRQIVFMKDIAIFLKFFDVDTVKRVVDLDREKINPIVKAESARFLSYCLVFFGDGAEKASPDVTLTEATIDDFNKVLQCEETLIKLSFLLQGHHGILLREALDGLLHVKTSLLKEQIEKIELVFDEMSDDYQMMLSIEDGDEDIEQLFENLDKLGDINISEEDVALEKMDEEVLKTQIHESMKRKLNEAAERKRKQDIEKAKPSANQTDIVDNSSKEEVQENREPVMKKVPMMLRIQQLSKDMFYYEEVEESDRKIIVSLAKEVLSKVK